MQRILAAFSFGILLTASLQVKAAIVIQGYSDATNDRFSNDAAFIGASLDWSGVGQAANGRWATAISRNVVISAFHLAPSGQVRFYEGNNPAATAVSRTIASTTRITGTDLSVHVLSSPLPSSIRHYNFVTEFLAGPPPSGGNSTIVDAGSLQNLNAYLVGRSPFNENSSATDDRFAWNDQAIGRNRITGYSENVPFFSNVDNDSLFFFRDAPGSADAVAFEAYFQTGDSGGPAFIDVGGELVLLGTNAFINDASSSTQFSGINYIGNQASAINSFIAVNAIPEPTSGIALLTFLALASRRRRRDV